MATKYFVLPTAASKNWSSTATWSNNSNGSPTGATVPGSGDDVKPSTNTVNGATLKNDAASQVCASIDFTGAANIAWNPATFGLSVASGNATFISGMSITASGSGITFTATSGTQVLKTGGLVINVSITENGSGGIVQLGDTCTMSGAFGIVIVSAGTFQCNGNTLTAPAGIDVSAGATFDYSGVTVTCGGYTSGILWNASATATITSTSSSELIYLCSTTATFAGGGQTYNGEVLFNSTGTYTITGSNTFNNTGFVLNSAVAMTVKFTNSTTQTVAACSLSGSLGNVHTLVNTSGITTWLINYTGAGTITVQYCIISYSIATPSSPNTWFYTTTNCTFNSTSGWYAYTPPTPPSGGGSNASKLLAKGLL